MNVDLEDPIIKKAYQNIACAVLQTVIDDGYIYFFNKKNKLKDMFLGLAKVSEYPLKEKTLLINKKKAEDGLILILGKPVKYSVIQVLKTKKFKTQEIADFFGLSYHDVNRLKLRMKQLGEI